MTELAGNADVADLRAEVAALRAELAALRAVPVPVERSMSRRGLLLGGAAAAAAAVVGSDILEAAPAAADTGTMRYGAINNAGEEGTELNSASNAFTLLLRNAGGGPAVYASGKNGPGLKAIATNGNAIESVVEVTTNGFNGVYGATKGTGNGVFGEALATGASANAVLGIAKGTGNSVFGFKDTGVVGDAVVGFTKGAGRGVVGISALGRGAVFTGKSAQVQMTPAATATHPSSGLAGDFFVDSGKRLWFCKGGTNWKQLA
jgi:hypothetical protein